MAFSLLLWELFTFNLLFQHVEKMYRVGGHLRVVEVKDAGEDLKRETRRQAVHPFVDPGVIAVFWYDLAFGSVSFRLSPSYTRILE